MVAIVISLQEVRVLILPVTILGLRTPVLEGPGLVQPVIQSDFGWHYCHFLLDRGQFCSDMW